MSLISNVGAIINGILRNAWTENARNMLYWKNKSAGTLTSGAVVIQSTGTAKAFTTTTTEADPGVVGVIPQIDTDPGNHVGTLADQSIAANALGWVQFVGDIATVNVVGAVSIGDFLAASTTAGRAKSMGTVWQRGVFARATSAAAGPGNGTVSAALFPTDAGAYNDAEGNPAAIGAVADGTSLYPARRDHVHAITTSENVLGANVVLTNANTFYDGPSLALTVGTWFLVGAVTLVEDVSGNDAYTAKLWNGTTVESSGACHLAAQYYGGSIHLSGIVTLAGNETWKISVAANTNNGNSMRAATPTNGAGNNASYLRAMRIA